MQAVLYYMWERPPVQENKSDHRDAEGLIQVWHPGPGKNQRKLGLLTLSSEQWQETLCFISLPSLILTLFCFKAEALLSHCNKLRCFHVREICDTNPGTFAGWVSEYFLRSRTLYFVRKSVCQDQWWWRGRAATVYKWQIFFTAPGVVTYFSINCVQKVITDECWCSDPCRTDHIPIIRPSFPKLKISEVYFAVSEITSLFSFFAFLHSFFYFLHSEGKKKSKSIVVLSQMKMGNGILIPVSHVLSSYPSLHQALGRILLCTGTESKEREKGLTCGSHRVTLTSHWWKVKNMVVPMSMSTVVT